MKVTYTVTAKTMLKGEHTISFVNEELEHKKLMKRIGEVFNKQGFVVTRIKTPIKIDRR